jgi:glucosamine-6-phosphate deaminase
MKLSSEIEKPVLTFRVDRAQIEVYSSNALLGRAAAARGADLIRSSIRRQGEARVIIATGNSQDEMVAALVQSPGIDWGKVTVFHMDEYLGISTGHRASFRHWLKEHLLNQVSPKQAYFLEGDAEDAGAEMARYSQLLFQAPIEVCFLGIGENGHIAFNDPHVADFNDPKTIKIVDLDERCRRQQVGEGHFCTIEEVPRQAITLTCPTLMRSENLVCCVPDARKAEAVRNALEGEIATTCPGSLLRTHPHATIYLDRDSATQLTASRAS